MASIDVRGGGTGTRESVLLDPSMTVEKIDAIALAGGSAFGLDAAAGVMAQLAEAGRGFAVRGARVPIIPGAILFDLLNGGDKAWGRFPPYRELGYTAAAAASGTFKLGTAGAGLRRHHRHSQRRHRFRLSNGRRHHRRRAGRGQRRGLGHRRIGAVVLGGAV